MSLRRGCVSFVFALSLFGGLTARAQNNTCEAGEHPDLIIGDIQEKARYGVVGDITAFAIANNTCNQGTCQANWIASTPEHPVFAQNMFRLKNDRFEQIGQSWVKHGFTALQQTLCSSACLPAASSYLGVNCSDPYSASLNGSQARLGPKFEVNPATGVFPYPPTDGSQTGDAIYKRLQVHTSDLDPALNVGAQYFVEIQVVAHDDATGGNQQNNATYRQVNISGTGGVFDMVYPFNAGPSQRQKAAIEAWGVVDPTVVTNNVTDGANGRIIVAAKATSQFSSYHYEYAVQNLTSARAVRAFRVPIPEGAVVRNVGFHDVDYHSGEPFSGTDWTVTIDASSVTFTTDAWDVNPNANALRWGTLYNFRFDTSVAPVTDLVRLDMFLPGSPASLTASTLTPNACLVNGICAGSETCSNCPADCAGQGGGAGCCGNLACEPGENPCRCAADCGTSSPFEVVCNDVIDNDCDGQTDCVDLDCCTAGACAGSDHDGDGFAACDCNDANADSWSTPGEALELRLTKGAGSQTILSWLAPTNPGGQLVAIVYDAIRAVTPSDFVASASCLAVAGPGVTTSADMSDPGVGGVFFYLVRATNGCPSGDGPLGTRSNGTPRSGRSCP